MKTITRFIDGENNRRWFLLMPVQENATQILTDGIIKHGMYSLFHQREHVAQNSPICLHFYVLFFFFFCMFFHKSSNTSHLHTLPVELLQRYVYAAINITKP